MLHHLRQSLRPRTVIVLWMVAATGILYGFGGHGAVSLHLYLVPVLLAGYSYGRRWALATAVTAIAVVVTLQLALPAATAPLLDGPEGRWYSLGVWAVLLALAAGITGHLHESEQRALDDVRRAYHGVLEMLSMFIDTADRYTEAHSVRVSLYATEIARQMGFEDKDIEDIRVASLLHDVGKLDVSVDLLRKVGELTPDEWDVIKRHPANGAWMLGRVGGLLRDAVPLVLYHHERWDGGGYYGLRREEIPLGARVIAVADAFDAMTTDRSYRAATTTGQALRIIRKAAGHHFDPTVVEVFVRAMEDPVSPLHGIRSRAGAQEPDPAEIDRSLALAGGA